MTAEVIAFPVGATADDTIRATIKALLSGQGISKEDLADAIGMSHATMYRRLAARGCEQAFKAGEVASIADALAVSVASLYSGLGGMFVPPDGGNALRARRDSNPKPSDPKVRPLVIAA